MLIKTLTSLGLALFCAELYGFGAQGANPGTSWETPSSSSTNTRRSTQRKAQKERAKKKSAWVNITKPQHGISGGGSSSNSNSGVMIQAISSPDEYQQPFHIDNLLQQVGGFETDQATGQCRNAVDQAKTKINSANQKIQKARIDLLSALQAKAKAEELNGNVQNICSREGGLSEQWNPGHISFASEKEAQYYISMLSAMQAYRAYTAGGGGGQSAQ